MLKRPVKHKMIKWLKRRKRDKRGLEIRGLVPEMLEYVKASYDLTPRGIIEKLRLLDVDYNQTSAYGHFGKPGLPWEE